MFKFYPGVATHEQMSYVPRFMVSYRKIRRGLTIPSDGKEWILDSGAFNEIKIHGNFTFSIEDYLVSVEKLQPSIFVIMDYMCEPFMLEKTGLSVRQHQKLTSLNHQQIKDLRQRMGLNVPIMGVIQGWTLEDYLWHIDHLKSQNLIEDKMGLGSFCRRQSTKVLLDLLREIKRSVPGWVKLHGFGVKINLFKKPETFRLLSSSDSAAWGMWGFGLKSNKNVKYCVLYEGERRPCIHRNCINCCNCGEMLYFWYNKNKTLIDKFSNTDVKNRLSP